ncbi:MAG: arsenate reductase (azurin) small subunit [Dehalococcoidia bacterium]
MTRHQLSRRDFLKSSVGTAGALGVGIFAFPPGLEVAQTIAHGVTRVTRSYAPLWVAKLGDLKEGEPLDFQYPLPEHANLLVKLGTPALDGVGPGGDVVAFSYACSHMGCPLNGQYRHDYTMLGPCACHFSRFDLSKNGIMILGQATQSLPQIQLEVQGTDIYAVAVMGLVYGAWNNLGNG